jgi:hypothetical protein
LVKNFPDHPRFRISSFPIIEGLHDLNTQIIDAGTIKKLVMFQIWGQIADVMQIIMIAGLFVMQLGIYCFFGEELIRQVR